MPHVEILSLHYVDGGIRENIPIRGALYNGATEIDVISMTPKKILNTILSPEIFCL